MVALMAQRVEVMRQGPPKMESAAPEAVRWNRGGNPKTLWQEVSRPRSIPPSGAKFTSLSRRRGRLAERGNDLYETPAEATEALLRHENLPHSLWEPCCGRGAITRELRASGRTVLSTDLVDYGTPDQDQARIDFLMEWRLPPGIEGIVTNPPFRDDAGLRFVEHAVSLCPKVFVLLPIGFLAGQSRYPILTSGSFRRVLIFSKRLPRMHRDGWRGRRATATQDFGWFIFDWAHTGAPTICHVRWERRQ
jgi:hypothetical protein